MNLSEYNSIYDVLVSTVPAALLLITTYYIYKNRNKSQLPSATKFFQGKEIVQISIYLAILMGISSILYYFSLSALSLVVFVTLGCMLLLNVMTRDPDDAERNRSFYAKNLKWLLVYVGVNFLIIYLLPFYISWIGTIGVFFLLTYKRKDKTRIRDAGHILLFKSKKEQWSWTGIFLLLVYVNFYHPFSVNIIYTYWFCLLICRYLLLSFGSRRIISPL